MLFHVIHEKEQSKDTFVQSRDVVLHNANAQMVAMKYRRVHLDTDLRQARVATRLTSFVMSVIVERTIQSLQATNVEQSDVIKKFI